MKRVVGGLKLTAAKDYERMIQLQQWNGFVLNYNYH
jgi:hypothetical protein